jgi:hypothetical protein
VHRTQGGITLSSAEDARLRGDLEAAGMKLFIAA